MGSARVTVVSAPAGSGKTVLLRSWMVGAGVAGRAASVVVRRRERDSQRFWLSVAAALQATVVGEGLVSAVSAAPDLDGWALVERLLEDLAPLRERLWLVIDDIHELDTAEALRQLELLILRAPDRLRFVLATRREVRLGLHRLRLEGELAEIRVADLRFSVAETRELFEAAGIDLPDSAVAVLHERTEGWVAGLRLAVLSLTRHPDPVRFATEFSGSERTVAEYLLAEVLERQTEQVRRLLLRTSILDRVSGELADLLTGDDGGERILQDLEQANAFVTSVDAARSWFRYHQLFAGLLQLELRRTSPDEIATLHRIAAGWLAGQHYPVEAIWHAQAAEDWDTATRLLAEHWPSLLMDGETGTIHELLRGFPAAVLAADGELALMAAADELRQAPDKPKEHYLKLTDRAAASVPVERQAHAQLVFGIVRLLVARHHWDLPLAAEAAKQLRDAADTADLSLPGHGTDLHALALVALGTTEYSIARFGDAVRHLELGAALARRIGRPYLEFTSLAYQAASVMFRSFAPAAELGERAMELARRHGWTEEPAAGLAATALATMLVWRGRLAEAESWHQHAEHTLRSEAEPAVGMAIRCSQGILGLALGRPAEALASFRSAERFADRLSAQNPFVTIVRGFRLLALVRLGDAERATAALAAFDAEVRESSWVHMALATLHIAQGAPDIALTTLAPVLDGSVRVIWPGRMAEAHLLAAIARDALGDTEAAEAAVERALDAAEPDGAVLWFLLHPVPALLERRVRHRTRHGALIAEIRNLLGSNESRQGGPQSPLEALSDSEIRVLRYLPTHLSAPDIARELSVSPNTVKTHLRNLYTKLGVHRRSEAVGHARALGLLAPAHQR
ncbi:LuxR C-terminal-related transcriptional regulator [Nocardia terpenica]|uniref:LuxR family transcriptional regulator n=1 Tax=Nocardia terpenica TaxID=455432 RepID=A0A6G9ZB50_9NOCA|nr:LuxR C-terminal-related transcriptional regulator [Nocardia terpenica]QIS22640.1 LuxR family transcriptional regulator [Nocardia terpenica]